MRRTAVGDRDNKGVRPIIASGGPDQRQGTYRGVVMWVRFPLSVPFMRVPRCHTAVW
jgi:hypothetical protein